MAGSRMLLALVTLMCAVNLLDAFGSHGQIEFAYGPDSDNDLFLESIPELPTQLYKVDELIIKLREMEDSLTQSLKEKLVTCPCVVKENTEDVPIDNEENVSPGAQANEDTADQCMCEQVVGLMGFTGIKGDTGFPGSPGFPGLDGVPGQQLKFGKPGKPGYPGSPGLDGLPGQTGLPGLSGLPAPAGMRTDEEKLTQVARAYVRDLVASVLRGATST